MSNLKELLNKDAEFARFRNIRNTVEAAIDCEEILREAEFLHSARSSRKLSTAALTPSMIQKALTGDMAARSRLTELRVLCSRTYELLSVAMSNVRRHIQTEYYEELSEYGKTQQDRRAAMDRLISKSIRLQSQIESTQETVDLYIKDIDQTAFGLRNLIDIFKITLDKREVNVT